MSGDADIDADIGRGAEAGACVRDQRCNVAVSLHCEMNAICLERMRQADIVENDGCGAEILRQIDQRFDFAGAQVVLGFGTDQHCGWLAVIEGGAQGLARTWAGRDREHQLAGGPIDVGARLG
jgi:hypothetical protein